MRLAFVVNDVMTEQPAYTTTRLAMTAVNMGHEAWVLDVGDFVYDPSGAILAHARSTPRKKSYRSTKTFLKDLQSDSARLERISVDDVDIVLLRNDPAEEGCNQPWAQTSGILFGQLAVKRGVIVLNNPASLANALNKTYFQHFPEQVRPKTWISRDAQDIRQFIADQNGSVVIKPLQGSGGQKVFLVREEDKPNLNQMIEASIRTRRRCAAR
jgi:glutathione synthase